MWKNLSLNPYGVQVQENEQGIRRYQISGGWKIESGEKIEVCRIMNDKSIINIASKAMSDIEISGSFQHNPYICASVWLTPPNIPTKTDQIFINKIKEKDNVKFFKALIENEIGKKVLFLWMMETVWSDKLPKWGFAINMKSPTLNRGVQIGLSKYLKENYSENYWVEIGIIQSSDSSSWYLNSENREIYSKKIDLHYASPYAKQVDKLPQVSIKTKNTFNNGVKFSFNNQEYQDNSGLTDDNIKKIVWITNRSIKHYGWESFKSWLSWAKNENTSGIFIFETKKIEKEADILSSMKNKKIIRKEIEGKNDECYIIYDFSDDLSKEKKNEKITLSMWAGEAPPLIKINKLIVEDEFGRVPYRALSKISKPVGMIPKRLEESIHQALVKLSKDKGDVDKMTAKLMSFNKKDLVNYVSAEQVDAISLSINAFEKKEGILLADETGFGKGRIVASLAKIGLKKGKTVIFITENKQLFSDFYRDLNDVTEGEVTTIPTVLHGNAKIMNENKEVIHKITNGTKAYTNMIGRNHWEKGEDKLIITTYSQINKANPVDKKTKERTNIKVEWIKNRIKDNDKGCWVLMDECHNAAGDSNVNDNLKDILRLTEGGLFSSATYAKTEKNMSLYQMVLNLQPWINQLLGNALENDDGELREALTTSMAKKGNFIRREHKPIDPPDIQWIKMDEKSQYYYDVFAQFWQSLHQTIALREKLAGTGYGMAWGKLGSYLSRAVKEFAFLMKVDTHILSIKNSLELGRKPFLAMESTFESAFRSVLEDALEDENDIEEEEFEEKEDDDNLKKEKKKTSVNLNGMIVDHIPLWKERLALIAKTALDMNDFVQCDVSEDDINQIKEMFGETLKILDGLPNWDLMPIEKILRGVESYGYNVGELSGRTLTYEKTEDGKYKIINLKKTDRVVLVNDINSGIIDFAIITLAGCTGISIHAGVKFKDQKQRELIEADIAVNVSKRIQFAGRVRRKDQVCEPVRMRYALETLTEKRTQAREERKKEQLAAHVGMKQDFEDISWISKEGEDIVAEWAVERNKFAMQIGVSKAVDDNPFGRVDRALLRSIILPVEEQESILSRLDRGLYLMKGVAQKERNIGIIKGARKIREQWLLGHPTRGIEDKDDLLSIPKINIVERVYEKNEQTDFNKLIEYLKECTNHKLNGVKILEIWKSVWLKEKEYNNITNEVYNNQVWNWLSIHLPKCEQGNAIRVTRPGESDITWGVIGKFNIPEQRATKKGASFWALSQVSMEVWLIGENEPINLPLLRLFNDPVFYVSGERADLNWFKESVIPSVGISIEGNPLLAAYWGKIWGIGKPMLVDDDVEGITWVWALPKLWNWDATINLPRLALNIHQLYESIVRSDKNVVFEAISRKPNQRLIMKSNQGIVSFEVDHETFKESISGWGNPRNRKFFLKTNYKGYNKDLNIKFVSFSIELRNIKMLLSSMEKNGVMWKMDNVDMDWYSKTSEKIMNEAIVSGSKILHLEKQKKNFQNKKLS